jgi:hypothetical protein
MEPKRKKRLVIAAVIVVGVVAIAAIVGYNLLVYDNRSEAAERILFDEDGDPIDAVLDSAMQARFPAGSTVETVVKFVEMQGGKCFGSPTLICRYLYEGTVCVAHSVEIEVSPAQGSIQKLNARFRGDYC